ncbi:MAG: hypothetical protein GIKADHBN_00828 [Phycisphaerales bacterium]|nr:hypothetical protein [Phycisphaerales bacterium]
MFVRGPGVMIPGQFGPMRTIWGPLVRPRAREAFMSSMTDRALIMSWTGTPSVMQQMTLNPAAAASSTASAASPGGTKIIVAVAPVAFTACSTVS